MIKYKTERIREEWGSKKLSNKLSSLVLIIDAYCEFFYDKNIIITEILRTHDEQKEYYKNIPNPPEYSVHEDWRGIDLVVENGTDEEHVKLEIIANTIPYGHGNYNTALFHDIGLGKHIHLQTFK